MALFGRESPREERRAEAWQEWLRRQHPYALASIVLSVFSLTHFGTLFVDEIAGIVLGVMALRKPTGKSARLAWIGIVAGVLSLVVAILIYSYPARV